MKKALSGVVSGKMEKLKVKLYDLLRRSEPFFKLDMVYVAKGSFWISFGQVTSSVISLFLVIAFANLLPKETYGLYRYILSLAGVLNIFTLTGMNSAVSRAVAGGNEGALKASVRYQFKWNSIMLAAFWVLGGYYFINGNFLLAVSFFILGIFTPSTLALNTYGAYLEGKREFMRASIASVISTLMYAAGILTAILLSGEVVWLIAAYSITTFLSTLIFYVVVLRKFKPPVGSAGETLKYGRELTFIGFIGPISSQADKIILTHFWGPAQLAVYSLAMAVPDKASSLIKSWVGLGFPKFAAKTPGEINAMFFKRILQGASFGILAAAAYVLAAPYLFKYLLPQYLDSVLYSQILAMSFVFAMPNRFVSLLLVAQKLSRAIFLTSVIQTILKILLYVFLGIWGGILGLVIANVLNTFFGLLISIATWKFLTN